MPRELGNSRQTVEQESQGRGSTPVRSGSGRSWGRLNAPKWLWRGLLLLLISLSALVPPPALAITAPELRGQRAVQQIESDMHGRNLQQQEFLKSDLAGVDFHGADLRGAVINGSNLQGADLRDVDLQDAVVFASRLDKADLRGALLRNAMLMQTRFADAQIADADFSGAVLDKAQRRALCARAEGTHPQTGISTKDSLECG